MRSIQIRLQSSDRFSEFLGDDVDQAELMIENIVAEALLQFFDTVVVEGVTVRYVADKSDADTVKSSLEARTSD